jgi:hypothetical protein
LVTDYPVSVAERRCSATGRALRPGERYYGVMFSTSSGFARHDFAADAWTGPPEKAVGFWSGKVPANDNRRQSIDVDSIHEHFIRLTECDDPSKINFRYVLALLLVRRKRLRLDGSTASILKLTDPKTGERHEVLDPGLQAVQLTEVQAEVMSVLTRAQG